MVAGVKFQDLAKFLQKSSKTHTCGPGLPSGVPLDGKADTYVLLTERNYAGRDLILPKFSTINLSRSLFCAIVGSFMRIP